jgi:hypothetical protein
VRRALGPIAAVWLFCHVAGIALVPVALWADTATLEGVVCTCGHGLDAACPMHHHKPAAPANRCAMQATHDTGAAVLASMFNMTGVLPHAAPAVHTPVSGPMAAAPDEDSRGDRPVPPDPPPPRA